MPASRSRTEHWWDCLHKIHERGGAIEISVNRSPGAPISDPQSGSDVVWRVKVVDLTPERIVVEPPAAFGKTIDLHEGISLIGAMTVGQNRWMFHTRTLGHREQRTPAGPPVRNLVLAAPDGVERCTRRSFYRISTADLRLPEVQCWPLLDPASVVAAETANRLQIEGLMAESAKAAPSTIDAQGTTNLGDPSSSLLLPEVGPMFTARMVNISGGGLGLRIDRNDASALERRTHFWLRVNLTPHIPVPVAVTARLAHTHIDSSQNIYSGMAFEFAFNQTHRKFVIDTFTNYVAMLTRQQGGATKSA